MASLKVAQKEAGKRYDIFSDAMDEDISNYSNAVSCFLSQKSRQKVILNKLDNEKNKNNDDIQDNVVIRKYKLIEKEKKIVNNEDLPNEKQQEDEVKYKPGFFSCIYSRYRNLISTIYKIFSRYYDQFNFEEQNRIQKIKDKKEKNSPAFKMLMKLDKCVEQKGTYNTLTKNKTDKTLLASILMYMDFDEIFDVFKNLSDALPDTDPKNLMSINLGINIELEYHELITLSLILNQFIKRHDSFLIMLKHLPLSELILINNIKIPENYEMLYSKVDNIFQDEPYELFRSNKRDIIANMKDYNKNDLDAYLRLLPFIYTLDQYYKKSENIEAFEQLKDLYNKIKKDLNSNNSSI